MKDRSLVAFTILSQVAVGTFWVLGGLRFWAAQQGGPAGARALTGHASLAVGPLMVLALLASFFHLGVPLGAWRALTNLRSSWLSREVFFAALFTGASLLSTGLCWFDLGSALAQAIVTAGTALLGLALLLSMAAAYRLRTIPAWDSWATPVSFFITALLLGVLATGTALGLDPTVPPDLAGTVLPAIGLGAVVLLGAELVATLLWVASLAAGPQAALRAVDRITRTHGHIFRLRLYLAVAGIAAAVAGLPAWGQVMRAVTAALAFGLVLAGEVLGRLLFYEARARLGV